MGRMTLRVGSILLLLLCVAVMLSGGWLKQPFSEDDRVLEAVHQLDQAIRMEDWEKASEHVAYLETAWSNVAKRVQFSVEREVIREMETSIYRLKGCVVSEDKQSAIQEIYHVHMLWENLGH